MNTPDRACVYNDVVITTPTLNDATCLTTPRMRVAIRPPEFHMAMMEQADREVQIKFMKEWCLANYERGADTMIECWSGDDYNDLFNKYECHAADALDVVGQYTFAEAFDILYRVVSVFAERQADAAYYARGERDEDPI